MQEQEGFIPAALCQTSAAGLPQSVIQISKVSAS